MLLTMAFGRVTFRPYCNMPDDPYSVCLDMDWSRMGADGRLTLKDGSSIDVPLDLLNRKLLLEGVWRSEYSFSKRYFVVRKVLKCLRWR